MKNPNRHSPIFFKSLPFSPLPFAVFFENVFFLYTLFIRKQVLIQQMFGKGDQSWDYYLGFSVKARKNAIFSEVE